VKERLATGYVLGPNGPSAVSDREGVDAGAGGSYASGRDVARYIAALLAGGANARGAILQPATLATMFEPHYQPDPRLVGMGLGFLRHDAAAHRVVSHEGILPGFNSALLVAPDDGLGLLALTNGSSGAMAWLPAELRRLLYYLLGVPDEVVRSDIAQHPAIWGEICGRYRLPARISDLRVRMMMGGGVQVFVRGGRLMLRVLTPLPALYRGLLLHPDDEDDPYVFRLDLAPFGMAVARLVFRQAAGAGTRVVHTDLSSQPLSLYKQPDLRLPRWGITGAAGALALAGAVTIVRRGRSRRRKGV
jgi:hypothetical protein